MEPSSQDKPLKRHPALQPLSRQHHHGLLLCWKIRQGVAKNVTPERIKKYADWFYENHLRPHFRMEEEYFFGVPGVDQELVNKAIADHRNLSEFFEKEEVTAPDLQNVADLLDSHIRFEERMLFNEIQEKASAEQLARFAAIEEGEPFIENNEDIFWGHENKPSD